MKMLDCVLLKWCLKVKFNVTLDVLVKKYAFKKNQMKIYSGKRFVFFFFNFLSSEYIK